MDSDFRSGEVGLSPRLICIALETASQTIPDLGGPLCGLLLNKKTASSTVLAPARLCPIPGPSSLPFQARSPCFFSNYEGVMDWQSDDALFL